MVSKAKFIPYHATRSFSKIVLDYLDNDPQLRTFYSEPVSVEGIQNLIAQRRNSHVDRKLLVTQLERQYLTAERNDKVAANIELLSRENTFTVTTAHQPNIFTGPLYFIYKILHAIAIAESLRREFLNDHFVPVFYIGSEDADLEELGVATIQGKEYRWETNQTGAVGRMLVDENFQALISGIQGQLGVLPFGNEILHHVRNCYSRGKTIEQATFEFVHFLFGEYGLVVLLPDNTSFKRIFLPVVEKELRENFSSSVISPDIASLSENYKVQAMGRDINLFYLDKDTRQRISINQDHFELIDSGIKLSGEDLLKQFSDHPERISPNVILRPLFQSMLLPDVAFVGGGGELAYWLELRSLFRSFAVPFPVLVLRNSFLLVNEKEAGILNKLGIDTQDVFAGEEELFRSIVVEASDNPLSLDDVIASLISAYDKAKIKAAAVDPTLKGHVEKLQKHALDKLAQLEKKILRAEKKKFETERQQLQKVRNSLFPNGSLQERKENFLGLYAMYGPQLLKILRQHSGAFEQQFGIIELKK